MSREKIIKSALISVSNKTGLEPIVKKLHTLGVKLYSTGGTESFINQLGIPVVPVETVTSYPPILGGRVKTLHPKVFGGILNRQNNPNDIKELQAFEIPQIDAVIVDLYPFENTVASGAKHQDIIENIDIGGISLIRAAAKNYADVVCIASVSEYSAFLELLNTQHGSFTESMRMHFATKAFQVTSHYDTAIFNFFNASENLPVLKLSETQVTPLRYGENPHQKGYFYGDFNAQFTQLNGKSLSYNNLLDVDAAVNLIHEFKGNAPTFAILKHNNACGLAQRDTLKQAYTDALAGDPVSAFGGVLISNTEIDLETAQLISKLFCEVLIAPSFNTDALTVLKEKKNIIILKLNELVLPNTILRSCLNGILVQDRNTITDSIEGLTYVTQNRPTNTELSDLIFASKLCKHTKSNTIVLVKNNQLFAAGTGQTSRVDALEQAIHKAQTFNFNLKGAVMASDAFFPFPDCVEIANKAGITAVIQPGGSIKDQLSIDYCNAEKMAMVFTGTRHFKH